MGKSINKVILMGRLGRDPELKYTASGTPFCRFSMATDERWSDKGTGEKTERTILARIYGTVVTAFLAMLLAFAASPAQTALRSSS